MNRKMLPYDGYAPWLVWLIPLVGSVLVPIMAKIGDKVRNWFAVIVSFVSAAYALTMIPQVLSSHGEAVDWTISWIPQIGLKAGVLVDPLSVFMANIAAGIGALIVLYSIGYMAHEGGLTRYYFFILFFIGGMTGLVMADNFLQLFIFWEIVGMCSYALIGFWYSKESASNAGMKAFIVTKVGDVLMLIGIIVLFAQTGSFNFMYSKEFIEAGKIAISGVLFISMLIFGGAVGKSAQFPLQVWLPDAMEGPTTVSALIHAATMVKAGVYLTARTFTLFSGVNEWLITVSYIGAITALLTATIAIVSTDIKRVLAYSTLSQLGLMIAALGLGTSLGWFASQFHVMSHAIFKALLFLCAGSVMHAVGTTDIMKMGGLRKYMPITFITGLIGILCLAGVPPFNGFWSKDLIILATLEHHLYPILILIILASIFTVSYSFRWLGLVFFGKYRGKEKSGHLHESPYVMTIPLIILAAFACISGFFEESFMNYFGFEHLAGLELTPLLISIAILIIGFIPAYAIYFRRTITPERFRTGSMASIHRMLSEGYYFDKLYYAIFVNGFPKFCNYIYDWIDLRIIDKINYAIADVARQISEEFRPSHTGVLSANMSGILVGLVGFLILVLMMLG